jgi:hypothetical protein
VDREDARRCRESVESTNMTISGYEVAANSTKSHSDEAKDTHLPVRYKSVHPGLLVGNPACSIYEFGKNASVFVDVGNWVRRRTLDCHTLAGNAFKYTYVTGALS